MQMNEKIEKESEGIQARLENMEKRLTALVDEKVENATKTTCEKLEKSYADVLSVKPVKDMKAQPGAGKEVKQEIHHNINKSFRIQGIREDPEKSKCENSVPTTEKVHEVLNKLGVKPQNEEIKRLGKFSKERIKSRALLITLSTEHEAGLVLAKSFEKRDELRDEEILTSASIIERRCEEGKPMLKKTKRTSRRKSSKGENKNQEFRAVQ